MFNFAAETKFLSKMKKNSIIYFVVAVVCAAIGFVSCDDDSDNGLSGLYGDETLLWGNTTHTYYFQNSNTVLWIPFAHRGKYIPEDEAIYADYTTKEIAKTGWYEVEGHPAVTYTYTYQDNKIYIPMQGVILTKQGNRLYEDGTSSCYVKMK